MITWNISERFRDAAVAYYTTKRYTNSRYFTLLSCAISEQDAQLSQRDRAAGCVMVFPKSRRLELGDNILRTV